jgi:F0F1-type ATP synthase membrane subunit b/b'
MFITTTEFLFQHRAHRQQVHQIISAAQARGQTRLAQINQQVADNLNKIITTLESDADEQPEGATDAS